MTPLQDGSGREPDPTVPAVEQSDAPVQPALQPELQSELSVVEDVAEDTEEEPRRYPSTVGGAFYLGILGLTAVALVVVGLGHWRGGVETLASGLLAAAAMRGLLPRRDLGMLAVRSRWFDVTLLALVGIALWVLASTIPTGG